MYLHGPLYWTGWFFLKTLSRGKYPNDFISDLPTTLIGMAIWIVAFIAIYEI